MPLIKHLSDIKNHFTEISKIMNETCEPNLPTRNDCNDMTVMSSNEYERLLYESSVDEKLTKAEIEAETNNQRYTHADVIASLRERVKKIDKLPPNAKSLAAMAEAERISRDPSVKGYRDMNALFEDLNTDK